MSKHRARKRFGQHFLVDPGVVDAIVRAVHPTADDVVVEIEAHTDSTGPEAYNQGLSQRRAESVIRVLTDRFGVPADRLVPRGYGESRPIAGNDTEEGRAANRRVVVSLSSK